MITVDDDLTATVTGPVFRPGDADYDEEVSGYNLAHRHTPDLVVGASDAADVVAAVRWAGAHGLPVAVQATGHGANMPIDHGVLINTRRMQRIDVDPDTQLATVGAGVKWQRLLEAAAPYGLVGLHGSSTDVGVVGYTVGGGLPILGRAFGYAAERLRSVELVTGDGRLHRVNATHEPELFWAVRGGKGNVGIVTAMTFELLHLRGLYGGGIFYAGEDAAAVLRAFARWAPTLPDHFCTSLAFLRLPPFPEIPAPLRGRFVMHLRVASPGSRVDGDRLLAPMRAVAPAIVDTVGELPYAAVDSIFQDPDHPVPAMESCVLLRDLPVDALLRLAGPGTDFPLLMLELRHLGGALAQPPASPDAISARDAAFLAEGVGIAAGPQAAAVPAAHAALAAALRPYGTGRTMVNLHGAPGDHADRARAWTPEAYARLRRLKAAHDPANLFRFGHAVAPLAG
ncbi:MAG TPA: FAD-binding oxidoreductase [Jatrophihabitans sp.]|nr:FAD-binding oxidoreductase [Jatrophihabitans sp.]